MNKELEVINLTLDLMKRFIQPTIFEGLKSDLNAIDFKLNRLAKVEELLGLYKELSIVRFYLFSETDADLGQELMNKDDNLNKQIKQLEDEMK